MSLKQRQRWTTCWSCSNDIMSQAECYYVKCRNGSFNLCINCYTSFLENSKEQLRPDRSIEKELFETLHLALIEFHEKMVEEEQPILIDRANKILGFRIHENQWYKCPLCDEVREKYLK